MTAFHELVGCLSNKCFALRPFSLTSPAPCNLILIACVCVCVCVCVCACVCVCVCMCGVCVVVCTCVCVLSGYVLLMSDFAKASSHAVIKNKK